MSEMNSMTLNGQKYDCFVDGVARSMASWSAVIGSATGENIAVSDASNYNLQGLRIFGKTTQDGTPTPDAPANLVSVGDGGNVTARITGKNILPYPYRDGSAKTVSGITFTAKGDGSISASGTATASANFYLTGYDFVFKKGVTYTVSVGSGFKSIGEAFLWIRDNGIDYTAAGINLENATIKTFTPAYDMYNAAVYIYIETGSSVSGTLRPQIEIGSGATPYEQYKVQAMSISTPNGLPGIPVTSGGNYTDANGQQWICDEIDFARGVYVKRVDMLALDAGSTRWKDGIFSAGDSHYIYLDDSSVVIDKGSLFTHGTYELNGIWANGKYCSSGAGYFQVVTDLTLDEWRAYLTEQKDGGTPVLLLYALQNFEATPLSEEEIADYAALHTYKDHTTVSNDAGAYMELEYVMDAKKYIDSQISAGIIEARVG